MKHTLLLISALLLVILCAACGTKNTPEYSAPVTEKAEASLSPSQLVSDGTAEDMREPAPPAPAQDTSEPTEPTLVLSDLTSSEGLEFESNGDGTCTLTGIGVCQDKNLVIPLQSPAGDTVTLIAEYAFYSLEDVDSVTLLNYNYEVDARAFQYGEMTQVHFIGGTPVIRDSAFASCEDLTEVTFKDCSLQLGEYAFYSCGKDAAVTFTNCTGTVEARTFQYGDLASLVMENCSLQLEESAFASCEDLTAIGLRNSAISAEEYAFYSAGDQAVVEITDCNLVLGDRVFQYASLRSLSVTGGTLETGESTFASCEDLATITLDGQNISLGEYAFYGCDDLTSVAICDNDRQNNVVTIDDRTFQYCKNLTTVVVGTGSVEIGESVFYGCADALSVVVAGQSYENLA